MIQAKHREKVNIAEAKYRDPLDLKNKTRLALVVLFGVMMTTVRIADRWRCGM